MNAMQLHQICSLAEHSEPLRFVDVPDPVPADNEILIRVSCCAVCHTELDEIEGRTPPPILPVIPGHQVIGRVEATGAAVTRHQIGNRVGVGWIYSACGRCAYCVNGNENLCSDFVATGRDRNGGYSQFMVAREDFAIPVPSALSDVQAAPLLCAGAIGYRSLKLCNLTNGQRLGLCGFGSSAHLVLKLFKHQCPDSQVFVFARSEQAGDFALDLGATWAGNISQEPPEKLDAIIDTTPAWSPALRSLLYLRPGGKLVINAIRKEESDKRALLDLDYASQLWMEKEIQSVANVTRADLREFLELAARLSITPEIQEFPLQAANKALMELHQSKIRGSKVLVME